MPVRLHLLLKVRRLEAHGVSLIQGFKEIGRPTNEVLKDTELKYSDVPLLSQNPFKLAFRVRIKFLGVKFVL